MDLFDMTSPALESLSLSWPKAVASAHHGHSKSHPPPPNPAPHLPDLAAGLQPLAHIPSLILGVQSDILFTVDQQQEVADALRMAGNHSVSYYELGGVWGHDTFLCVYYHSIGVSILTQGWYRLDVLNVGGAMRGFLS